MHLEPKWPLFWLEKGSFLGCWLSNVEVIWGSRCWNPTVFYAPIPRRPRKKRTGRKPQAVTPELCRHLVKVHPPKTNMPTGSIGNTSSNHQFLGDIFSLPGSNMESKNYLNWKGKSFSSNKDKVPFFVVDFYRTSRECWSGLTTAGPTVQFRFWTPKCFFLGWRSGSISYFVR